MLELIKEGVLLSKTLAGIHLIDNGMSDDLKESLMREFTLVSKDSAKIMEQMCSVDELDSMSSDSISTSKPTLTLNTRGSVDSNMILASIGSSPLKSPYKLGSGRNTPDPYKPRQRKLGLKVTSHDSELIIKNIYALKETKECPLF